MGSVSGMRGRHPASVLITVIFLAVVYWLVPPSSDSTRRVRSDAGASPPSAVANGRTNESVSGGNASPGDTSDARTLDARTSDDTGFRDSSLTREVDREARGSESRGNRAEADASSGPLYGFLREVSDRRYLSPEGLLYGPGSAEGHRLEHLRRHTEDDPSRPGSHGVFDGGMSGALKTIDLAYQQATTGQRTTKEVEDDRTIFTVDVGRRIGFVGGSEGKRRGNPMARRIRLVLEGNYVVTAFPL